MYVCMYVLNLYLLTAGFLTLIFGVYFTAYNDSILVQSWQLTKICSLKCGLNIVSSV